MFSIGKIIYVRPLAANSGVFVHTITSLTTVPPAVPTIVPAGFNFMRRLLCNIVGLLTAVLLVVGQRPLAAEDAPKPLDPAQVEFFEQKIRPLLTSHCLECHSADTAEGSLRLDIRDGWMKGGDSGRAINPGKPHESLLIKMVRNLPVKMPPEGKLADDEVADLVKWVEMGAPDPRDGEAVAKTGGIDWAKGEQHWAYQPVKVVEPPKISDAKNVSAIDRFIAAQWSSAGVKPTKLADKYTLIRRASFTLTGLPPTLAEVQAFEADASSDALAKVVDRLLASPRYGEHQARQWLDIARYAEDKFPRDDQPGTSPFRYRDWVIDALNEDMPYDRFVKLQIAADLVDGGQADPRHRAALGFFTLGPTYGFVNDNDRSRAEQWSDRIDVLSRGFLGLTVACARCHDHKYDPIPNEDYYSLVGVLASSNAEVVPVSAKAEIERYDAAKKQLTEAEEALKAHVRAEADRRAIESAKLLPELTAQVWSYKAKLFEQPELKPEEFAATSGLNPTQFAGVHNYLMSTNRGDKHYLHPWFAMLPKKDGPLQPPGELRTYGEMFRDKVIENIQLPTDKRNADQINELFGEKGPFPLTEAALLTIAGDGWKSRHAQLAEVVQQRAAQMPPEPAKFLALQDEKPQDIRIHLRGNPHKRGEIVERRFLKILSPAEREHWNAGSGRLQLAEAIADPDNPLTARVMANRVWQQHFGAGIVETASNFGEIGARPTHPELLDYLALQLVRGNWSLKKLHREIVLSAAYQRASTADEANLKTDPENRWLWRYSPRRHTVEQFRDSVLAAAGTLNVDNVGGPGDKLDELTTTRRTVYGRVSRTEPSKLLTLWDFADPNITIDRRNETTLPQQMLFLMNSPLMIENAKKLAARIDGEQTPEAKVRKAYELVFARPPTQQETALVTTFLTVADVPAEGEKPSELSRVERFAQSLLASNEFFVVN